MGTHARVALRQAVLICNEGGSLSRCCCSIVSSFRSQLYLSALRLRLVLIKTHDIRVFKAHGLGRNFAARPRVLTAKCFCTHLAARGICQHNRGWPGGRDPPPQQTPEAQPAAISEGPGGGRSGALSAERQGARGDASYVRSCWRISSIVPIAVNFLAGTQV